MDKKENRINSFRTVIWLLLVMMMLIILPGVAFADVGMVVDIDGDKDGHNYWEPMNMSISGDGGEIYNIEIDKNTFKDISCEVTALHKVKLTGEIELTDVVDAVYVDSLDIYLEYSEKSDGIWEVYQDANVDWERFLYTGPFEFTAFVDANSWDMESMYWSGYRFRWRFVLNAEREDGTPIDISAVEQDITKGFDGY